MAAVSTQGCRTTDNESRFSKSSTVALFSSLGSRWQVSAAATAAGQSSNHQDVATKSADVLATLQIFLLLILEFFLSLLLSGG